MNEGILVACLIFAGIGYLAAASLYFSGRKARDQAAQLQLALQAAESRVGTDAFAQQKTGSGHKDRALEQSQRTERSLKKEKMHADELVVLRKELGQLRHQLQQLKQENKDFGTQIKDAVHEKEIIIFQLQKDKEHLIASLKEAEEKNAQRRTPAPTASSTVKKADAAAEANVASGDTAANKLQTGSLSSQPDPIAELSELKKKLASLERTLKSEKEQAEKLKSERQNLQAELKKWTTAAMDSDGKPLEPTLFKKWKDRALTARVQYQMMKQLREMSDIKLATYQESVLRLAEFVFSSTGSKAPIVRPGENTTDRFLAEALYALARRQNQDAPEFS